MLVVRKVTPLLGWNGDGPSGAHPHPTQPFSFHVPDIPKGQRCFPSAAWCSRRTGCFVRPSYQKPSLDKGW